MSVILPPGGFMKRRRMTPVASRRGSDDMLRAWVLALGPTSFFVTYARVTSTGMPTV
jgi:hypothetical protein